MTWDWLLWLLTALGVLAGVAFAVSLVDGLRFRRRVLEARVWDHTAFLPRTLVLVPCRGDEPGLEENLDAVLSQDHPAYRVVFCVDGPDDPAMAAIERARARRGVPVEVAIADGLAGVGGKANALLGGLRKRMPADEAVAFLDTDVRPPAGFLRALLQPLADPEVGGTTGYRWYVPEAGGLWSAVRSAWNAAGLNIFFRDRYNFLWGGAWAIRRETLDRLDLPALWRGTLSEDLAVTAAVKSMGLRVRFVPQAVAPSFGDCDRAGCREWTDRQTAMVAVWGRHIRNFAALTYGVFDGALLLGLACVALAGLLDPRFLVPAALFLADVPATVAKGAHRRGSVFLGSPGLAAAWRVPPARWALANLIVPWAIAGSLARTRRVRSIDWRGRRYEVSPSSVAVAGDGPPPGPRAG